jgi:hypothetical protein
MAGDQGGKHVRPKAFEPAPERDVGIRRLLCLKANEVLECLGYWEPSPAQEQLPFK